MLPLLDRKTEGWRNEVYFEMSEFVTGRGLRTPEYTYAISAPKAPGWRAAANAEKYVEYVLYDNNADPYQHVNLAGRAPFQRVTADLRRRMLARMKEAGDPAATKRYLAFLNAGGSKYPIDLLKDAGVDMTTDEPLELTVKKMNRVMDQIEALLGRE